MVYNLVPCVKTIPVRLEEETLQLESDMRAILLIEFRAKLGKCK